MSSNPSVKVARPGWDVNTAPDWALVFSSDWPSLQIAFETTVSGDTEEIQHNLGYPPLAMGWVTYNGICYGRLGGFLQSDKTTCFLDLAGTGIPSDAILTIRCFNVDISQEASYTLPTSAGAKQAPDLTTFVKIVKQNPNRSITSNKLNDFVLNSQAQSPAVLTVATQSGQYAETIEDFPGSALYYPLQTAYIPWVTGATSSGDPGEDGEYSYYNPIDLGYDQTGNAMILPFSLAEGGASLIILRDPLFYPNVVRVIY